MIESLKKAATEEEAALAEEERKAKEAAEQRRQKAEARKTRQQKRDTGRRGTPIGIQKILATQKRTETEEEITALSDQISKFNVYFDTTYQKLHAVQLQQKQQLTNLSGQWETISENIQTGNLPVLRSKREIINNMPSNLTTLETKLEEQNTQIANIKPLTTTPDFDKKSHRIKSALLAKVREDLINLENQQAQLQASIDQAQAQLQTITDQAQTQTGTSTTASKLQSGRTVTQRPRRHRKPGGAK